VRTTKSARTLSGSVHPVVTATACGAASGSTTLVSRVPVAPVNWKTPERAVAPSTETDQRTLLAIAGPNPVNTTWTAAERVAVSQRTVALGVWAAASAGMASSAAAATTRFRSNLRTCTALPRQRPHG